MGNRAVITVSKELDVANSNDIGVYLHWNGGRDSVEAFLLYCKLRGYRSPETDNFGWARLCQVIGNYFGGDLSIGIDRCCCLDCDNWDNGVYVIENWEIVDRKYMRRMEQQNYRLADMILDIDEAQPKGERLAWRLLLDQPSLAAIVRQLMSDMDKTDVENLLGIRENNEEK